MSVKSAHIVDDVISTADILDDQVTNDKLANITRGSVKTGGASDAPTDLNAKTTGQLLVGDGTDIVSVAMSGEGGIVAAGTFTAKHVDKYLVSIPGTFEVYGDGTPTTGGSIAGAGETLDVTLTKADAAFCKVEDGGAFLNFAVSIGGSYSANYQFFPDTQADNDAIYFGHSIPFPQIYIDTGTVQTYTGDGLTWEYYDGSTWSGLTVQDNTDATAQDGKRSFGRDGAIVFIPPADWASSTVDSQDAYWIRARVSTNANVNNNGTANSVEHKFCTPTDGPIIPHNCNISTIRLTDGNATVHTTADVKFFLMNFTKGTYSIELTFAMDKRQDVWTTTALKAGSAGIDCDAGDVIGCVVTQEDTSAEVTNAILELSVTLT